jgi:hypothetical protein
MLDLKEIALGIKEEQDRVTALLQAIHEFAATQLQPPPAPNYAQAPCKCPISQHRRSTSSLATQVGAARYSVFSAAASAGPSPLEPGSASATISSITCSTDREVDRLCRRPASPSCRWPCWDHLLVR